MSVMREIAAPFPLEGGRAGRAAAVSRRRLPVSSAAAALAVLLTGSPPVTAQEAAARHLIYLHGRIVQDQQSARPRHPRFGYYEVEAILAAFRKRGFAVSGEIRPKSASVAESADRVATQVRLLLDSGVPADHVTVVGASMGAGIALVAAARLHEPGLRFAILGACLSENVRAMTARGGRGPSGHVLSIREASDEATEPCAPWKNDPGRFPSLEAREKVLHTGLAHGFLYCPLPEWVDPVVEWALAKP
jgi:pimeloyl-ACP methyl ester carboxylesterase